MPPKKPVKPPKETRSEQLQSRYTPSERAAIEAAAERENRKPADWVRIQVLRALGLM